MAGVKTFLRLLLLLLVSTLLAVAAAEGDDPTCPRTALQSQAKRASQVVYPGQGVKLKVTWANQDRTRTVANGVLQLQLPLHTKYKTSLAVANKRSLARMGNKRPTYDPETRLLTWRGVTLRPGGAVQVAVRVKLEPCYFSPGLDFVATSTVADSERCTQEAVTSVIVSRRRSGRNSGTCTPTRAPTTRPTFDGETYAPSAMPSTRPSKVPSGMPTVMPSAAPTVSCVPGEFRPAFDQPCAFCAPGTYWNETSPAIQATTCQPCAEGNTSLQGATTCYEPCQPNSALNTTDLTCVPIPASLESIAAANNVTIDFNTTEVFIVTEPGKLEDTIGAAVASSNETAVVIVLGPGLYPQTAAYTLTSNVFILVDNTGGVARRRLGALGPRHLLTELLKMPPFTRIRTVAIHHVQRVPVYGRRPLPRLLDRLLLGRRGASGPRPRVLLQHDLSSLPQPNQRRWLLLTGGSSALVGLGSAFFSNEAAQGGAIYVGAGCAVTVENAVPFVNNSAPATSASTGGGGAIYLAGSLPPGQLGADVLFEDNVADDVTVATGSSVACAEPGLRGLGQLHHGVHGLLLLHPGGLSRLLLGHSRRHVRHLPARLVQRRGTSVPALCLWLHDHLPPVERVRGGVRAHHRLPHDPSYAATEPHAQHPPHPAALPDAFAAPHDRGTQPKALAPAHRSTHFNISTNTAAHDGQPHLHTVLGTQCLSDDHPFVLSFLPPCLPLLPSPLPQPRPPRPPPPKFPRFPSPRHPPRIRSCATARFFSWPTPPACKTCGRCRSRGRAPRNCS